MSSDRNVPIWRRGWPPSSLTIWFMAIIVFDAIMLILAMGIITTGNDPAGNGMVDGFRQGFAQLCASALALLTLIFLVIRHRGIRIALMVMLVPLIMVDGRPCVR